VRHDCLEPLKLSVTKGAEVLGVTRQALNNLLNGKSGVSPEMAVRLSKAFGGSPAVWLKMQMDYDLARIERGLRRSCERENCYRRERLLVAVWRCISFVSPVRFTSRHQEFC